MSNDSNILVIKTKGNKKPIKPTPRPDPWWKGKNKNQQAEFVISLDWMDKGAVNRK